MKYIALLRGINVGGHKIIPMIQLKSIFESGGFKNVVTYIQSGNVLFDSAVSDSGKLRLKIEAMLKQSLGYDVRVLIRTMDEMKKIVAKNPFTGGHAEGKTKFYVTFLEAAPSKEQKDKIMEFQTDGFSIVVHRTEIYSLLDAKFSGNNTPFSNTAIEKILDQSTTTRNWATVSKLLAMSQE